MHSGQDSLDKVSYYLWNVWILCLTLLSKWIHLQCFCAEKYQFSVFHLSLLPYLYRFIALFFRFYSLSFGLFLKIHIKCFYDLRYIIHIYMCNVYQIHASMRLCCDSTIAMRLFYFSQLYTIIANDEPFFLNIQLQWLKRYNSKLNKQRYATALPMFLTAFSMIMLDNIIQTKPRKKWDKTERKFVITTDTKIVQKKKQISQNYRSSSA